jgi:hypothetical protein
VATVAKNLPKHPRPFNLSITVFSPFVFRNYDTTRHGFLSDVPHFTALGCGGALIAPAEIAATIQPPRGGSVFGAVST